MKKIGIAGASTTGMFALIAASYYPQITLTIAMTPCDFVMVVYENGKYIFALDVACTDTFCGSCSLMLPRNTSRRRKKC